MPNQPCMTRSSLIYLNPDKLHQGLRHYEGIVSLDRCIGSCINLDSFSDKICSK